MGRFKQRHNKKQSRRLKIRGGTSYVAYNATPVENNGAPLDMIGRTIPFNTSTGSHGVDPLAPVNITDSRLIIQQRGGKTRRLSKTSRKIRNSRRNIRRRKTRGGLGFSSLGDIHDFVLGPRTNMNQVTSFGTSAGGIAYTHNQLTGNGNSNGPSLMPNMGPPSRAMV